MINREITNVTPEGAFTLLMYAHVTGDKELRDEVIEELPEGYRWHILSDIGATDEERVHDSISIFGMYGFDAATRKGIEELAKENPHHQPWMTVLLDKNPEDTHRRRASARKAKAEAQDDNE